MGFFCPLTLVTQSDTYQVAMTQRIKLLVLIISTLCLTHCADGPNGRHIVGLGMTGQPKYAQTGSAFTNGNNGQYPVSGLLQAILDSRKQLSPEQPAIDQIDFSTEVNWNDACKDSIGGTDTDKDGLPDDCEASLPKQNLAQYGALDPYTYNGWILGGRYFDGKDKKLDLTDDESKKWLKDKNERGGIGFGNISTEAQRVIKKFSVIKETSMSDVYPWAEIFYNYSQEPIRVGDNFHAYERSDLFQINQNDDQNLALATGDNDQSLPYHRNRPANSVAGLTAFGKDTDSYREHHKFKVIAYETNVKIPAGIDGLQVTVGYLSGENPYLAMTPKSGAYYVINNGDTVLLQNQLLNDHGQVFQGSNFGTIYRSTGCDTAHLIIIYVTSGSTDDTHAPILPEVVAFRTGEGQKWSTLGQGYFSVQPQGGIACQQTFNANDPSNTKTFFRTSLNVSKRVNGVADFNSSLGTPGTSNPFKMLDKKSTTLDYIKSALGDKPISSMTAQELADFENALYQINASGLSADDQKWLTDLNKQIGDRKQQIKQEDIVNGKLKKLEQLLGDPDYAKNAAAIDALITELGGNKLLTADQQQKLNDLTAKNTGLKTPPAPKVDPKTIVVKDQGEVTLTVDDMMHLRLLGFKLVDENGNEYSPVAGQTKKISKEQLDSILKQLGEQLESGNYAPGVGPKDIAEFISILEKEGVQPDTIADFKKQHENKLPNFSAIEKKLIDPTTLSTYPIDQRIKDLDDMKNNGLLTPDQYIALRLNIEKLRDLSNSNFSFKPGTIPFGKNSDGTDKLRNVIMLEGATIQFDSGTNKIKSDSQQLLKRIAKEVQNYKKLTGKDQVYVLLRAFTDPSGSAKTKKTRDENNMKLSQCRASSVKDFFAGKISIDQCNGVGKIVSKFGVVDNAKMDPAQVIAEANINAQGMGPDYTKGAKPTKVIAETLRRVEIYLSETPF